MVKESFEFDSRLWRTLRLLLFKPGELSAEFSRNRRAHYMSPARLYLLTSILFITVVSLVSWIGPPESAQENLRAEIEEFNQSTSEEKLKESFSELKRRLGPESAVKIDAIRAREGDLFVQLGLMQAALGIADAPELSEVETGFARQFVDLAYAPGDYINRVIDNLALGLAVSLPIVAVLFKLMYIRGRWFFFEHLVFVIHFQVFTMLFAAAFIPIMLLLANSIDIEGVYLTIVALYGYFAIRRFFGQGRFKSFVKWVALSGAAGLMSLIIVGGVFAVAAYTF